MPTPATTDLRADRSARRRQEIVEAAVPLFAELGYADCDMERVAAAIGIAKGTLYLYFPGKQDLFFACVDRGMSQMQAAIREALASTEDAFEQIGRSIRAYLRFFETHPQYVELLIQERAIFRDRKRPTYFEHRDANRGTWRDLYGRLVATGRLRGDMPVERMLDTIGSLVYGTMFTNHFIGRSISPDEQYAALMEAVFRGLLSDPEREGWTLPRTK